MKEIEGRLERNRNEKIFQKLNYRGQTEALTYETEKRDSKTNCERLFVFQISEITKPDPGYIKRWFFIKNYQPLTSSSHFLNFITKTVLFYM